VEIMGSCMEHPGTSALLWKFMQSRMQGDSLFSFSQLIMSAE
jgi:hypothetical protein